jgi:putative hydrolase of the HAD superfamily
MASTDSRPIRVVLFDLYDTLVGVDWEPIHAARAVLADRVGIDPTALAAAFDRTVDDRMQGRLGDSVGELGAVLSTAGARAEPAVLAELSAMEARSWREGVSVYGDVPEFLTRLRADGLRLGLVSNCTHQTRQVIDRWDLARQFDALVLSFEVGRLKPDPAIFELALERLHGSPGTTLLVDDRDDFLAAAERLGIRPCLISRGKPPTAGRYPTVTDVGGVRSALRSGSTFGG